MNKINIFLSLFIIQTSINSTYLYGMDSNNNIGKSVPISKKRKYYEIYDHSLHNACSRGDINEIKGLLKNGADVNAVNSDECTPLIETIKANIKEDVKLAIIKLLIDNDADVNLVLTNRTFATALHEAVNVNHATLIRLLNEKGANLNTTNKNGDSPLHLAAKLKKPRCIIALTDSRPKIFPNKAGFNPFDIYKKYPHHCRCKNNNCFVKSALNRLKSAL